MIGISIAAKKEWEATCEYFGSTLETRQRYPYGGYFITNFKGKDVLIYFAGNSKVRSAAACQYMIDRFRLEKVIVAGTCAGIDTKYDILDIIIPNRAVQCDCTVRELKPLIRNDFVVDIDLSKYSGDFNMGTIGTSDHPIVLEKDYRALEENGITVADMEAAAIAYVCMRNEVETVIIKGISDIPSLTGKRESAEKDSKNIFSQNVAPVMKKIFDQYLEKFI